MYELRFYVEWNKKVRNFYDKSQNTSALNLRFLWLKVHKHEIFFLTFFAETETIWSQGPVTRDF